jgi:hypothetical protein
MPVYNVKELCETTQNHLKKVCIQLEQFLNTHSVKELMGSSEREKEKSYYEQFLSDLRHLLVSCELANENLGVSLRRATFNVEFAEKILYDVMHTCVYNFFYPRNEVYSEDGRNAYTGKDAINFRQEPTEDLKVLIISLSKTFEYLREELHYYETDYVTQRRLQGEQI